MSKFEQLCEEIKILGLIPGGSIIYIMVSKNRMTKNHRGVKERSGK